MIACRGAWLERKDVQVSAESRWFWRQSPPDGWRDWFCQAGSHDFPAGGGKQRADNYLRDANQTELGIKLRGGNPGVEVKGLVSRLSGGLLTEPFIGPIELWAKWTSEILELDPRSTIVTQKIRWIRKFGTSEHPPRELQVDEDEEIRGPLADRGCNVEFTKLTLPDGELWWTLGFEAFGKLADLEDSLRNVVVAMALRNPPNLGNGESLSYPAFLKRFLDQ
jgi:hypothetical protein